MPDIFDEVEEDLRNERARTLARRYAGYGAAALVLILVATGVSVAWQQRRQATNDAIAARFIVAAQQADRAVASLGGVKAADADAAKAALAGIVRDAPDGYRTLSRLRLATLQWQTGQHPQAVATWQAVADDSGAPALMRDLATLTSAQHQLDTGDPVLVRQRLESLTAPDNHWRPMAEQVIALLDVRTGRTRDAAAILQRLSNESAIPDGIRQMATDLLSTLPAGAAAPVPPTPAAPMQATRAHG